VFSREGIPRTLARVSRSTTGVQEFTRGVLLLNGHSVHFSNIGVLQTSSNLASKRLKQQTSTAPLRSTEILPALVSSSFIFLYFLRVVAQIILLNRFHSCLRACLHGVGDPGLVG